MPGGTRGYNVWTPDEEDALRRGVKKHGLGAWEVIRKDPEFSVLENRTGVQLKDKFRNLVKFRHISQEESRSLKPKGSGPWSRKHSASSFINERSITRTPSANEIPGANVAEEHDNTAEHAAALLALEAGKAVPDGDTTAADAGAYGLKGLPRPRGRSMGGFETCSDDEAGGGGPEAAARRKRRRSLENRSFGIYDQRRYRSDGTLRTPGDDERTATESDGDEPSRPARQRRSNSGGRGGRVPRGRTRGRRRVDDDSEETTTEEEEFPSEDERADEADVQPEDDYVVDCPCGIRYDDGAMMVECEACKTWAHIDCLQYQATNNPTVVYDLNNYTCLQCQNKRNPLLAGGLVKTAKASNGPGKGRLPNGADLMMNADTVVEHLGGLTSRYSRDRTQEAGHVLLGLANGDMRISDGAPGLPRTGSKQSLRGGALPGMPTLPQGLSSGILTAGALQTPAYLDSLSLFLAATARPNSALGGHPAGSPTSPSKMITGSGRGAIAVPRAERLASGPLTTAADRSASQQNLDKLLAAANIPLDSSSNAGASGAGAGASGDGGLGAGGASALRQPSLLADGGAGSPNGLSALRRAGSSSAAGHLSSVAALSSLARPASRGPTGQELFGDSDDDLHHSAALAQLFNTQTSNDRLLQMLASNRVATPSQMFLEQLMRGATPDINLAPLIQGAALQGAAAAAAAAAAASHQLQILHQHGLTGAHSLLQPDTSGMLPAGLAQALQMQAMMAAQGLGVPPTGPAPGTGGASTGGNADKAVDKARPGGGINPDDLVQLAAAVSAQNSLGMHAMELRPGTPDTWALLRGSTPTPDAMGLHSFGIPPLAGFPTDPTWLLQRGSPALVNHADAQQLPAVQAQIAAASQQGAGGTQPAIKKEPAPVANGSGSVAGQASKDDQQQQAQPAPPAPEKVNEETKSAVAAPAQQPPVPTSSGSTPAAADAAVAPAVAAAPAVESAAPAPAVKTEQGAAAAATAMAEAAASSAAAAAARSLPASSSAVAAAVLGGPSVAAVMELVDRKSSLGALGSAGDLAAAVAACAGGNEEAYFNVEDMLRSSTPALR